MGRPGKFEGNEDQDLAERLYANVRDGSMDDQFGSVDELGWYGLVADYENEDDRLYIVEEDSNGFFTIVFEHEDEDVVKRQWARMVDEYTAWLNQAP